MKKFFSLKLKYYISSIIKIKLMTERQKAIENLSKLREAGVSDEKIVDYLICNWMTGDDAKQATEDLLSDEEIEDEDDGSNPDDDVLIQMGR